MTRYLRVLSGIFCFALGCSTEPVPGEEFARAAGPTDREACVARINELRATLNRPPLARWTDGEACADRQVRKDAAGEQAHLNFTMCGEAAQNTCPSWPSIDDINTGCIQAMWDQGPGDFQTHGDFLNLSSTAFTKVACGYDEIEGDVWSNLNFR